MTEIVNSRAQVFAPGAATRFGIGNSPIVVALGFSVVPEGRHVEAPAMNGLPAVDEDATSLRLFVTLAVDVSIWNF